MVFLFLDGYRSYEDVYGSVKVDNLVIIRSFNQFKRYIKSLKDNGFDLPDVISIGYELVDDNFNAKKISRRQLKKALRCGDIDSGVDAVNYLFNFIEINGIKKLPTILLHDTKKSYYKEIKNEVIKNTKRLNLYEYTKI